MPCRTFDECKCRQFKFKCSQKNILVKGDKAELVGRIHLYSATITKAILQTI